MCKKFAAWVVLLASMLVFVSSVMASGVSSRSIKLPVTVANGGTGGTTEATARAGIGAAASGDNSDITSLAGITGVIASSRPCASGYTRVRHDYCQASTPIFTSLTRDVCQPIPSAGGASGAREYVIHMMAMAGAANAIAVRSVSGTTFRDSACTSLYMSSAAYAVGREDAVQTAGAHIAADSVVMRVAANAVGGQVSVRFADDTGNNGFMNVTLLGYYD